MPCGGAAGSTVDVFVAGLVPSWFNVAVPVRGDEGTLMHRPGSLAEEEFVALFETRGLTYTTTSRGRTGAFGGQA